MSKVTIEDILFTQADAVEALETIARLEEDERGSIPARPMYGDPTSRPTGGT